MSWPHFNVRLLVFVTTYAFHTGYATLRSLAGVVVRSIVRKKQHISTDKSRDSATRAERSDEENLLDQFIEKNDLIFGEHNKCRFDDGNGVVFTELLAESPPYVISNLIVAKHLSIIEQKPIVALLRRANPRLERVARSFGVAEVIYLEQVSGGHDGYSGAPFSGMKARSVKSVFKAAWSLRCVCSIKDVIDLSVGDMQLGKIIYDDQCRKLKQGTFDAFNKQFFFQLEYAFRLVEYFAYLLHHKGSQCHLYVSAETQFVPHGVLAAVALNHGAVLYKRQGGPNYFTVERFDQAEQLWSAWYKYGLALIKKILDSPEAAERLKQGRSGLARRFIGQPLNGDITDTFFVYGADAEKVSREEFCSRMGLCPEKKIVVVFCNVVTDGIFNARRRLFRDNQLWLRHVLQQAVCCDGVSWVFKRHPSDSWYGTASVLDDELNRLSEIPDHVKAFPPNIASSSLHTIADAVFTVNGTCGMEYAALGVPVIVAAEAFYSDLGMCIEPRSTDEFDKLIAGVGELTRLSEQQVDIAEALAYVDLYLAKVCCRYLPTFDRIENRPTWNSYLQKQNVHLADYSIEDDDLFLSLKRQVTGGKRFCLN